jgi:nucleotide-binding universal stress UspA family protein
LIVTHEFAPLKNPILAYDGSHSAKKALSTAATLCSDLGLPLTVLQVGSDSEAAKQVLKEAKAYLDSFSLTVKYEHAEGKPHEAVPQYVKRHNHDLLLMGARGHNAIIDFILGSTTQYALWSGHCHVLVNR